MKKLVSTLGIEKKEWLRYRKGGIGGSDAGAVCGLNPYRTAMEVYYDKTSDEIEEIDNEAMRQGREFEEYVARRFMEATGKKVRRANALYYDERHPFMYADVDRLVVGENAGLECKTASPYMADQWKGGKIPLSYQIQCYHYMSVFQADAWYIAVLIYGKEFQFHRIERDEAVISDLIHIEKNFWKDHVEKKILPLFHAKAEGLGHQKILETVHRQSRQLIRFAENQTAGRKILLPHNGLAVFPGIPQPALEKSIIKPVIRIAAEQADADFRMMIKKAGTQIAPLLIAYIHDLPVCGTRLRLEDVIVIDPGVAVFQLKLSLR